MTSPSKAVQCEVGPALVHWTVETLSPIGLVQWSKWSNLKLINRYKIIGDIFQNITFAWSSWTKTGKPALMLVLPWSKEPLLVRVWSKANPIQTHTRSRARVTVKVFWLSELVANSAEMKRHRMEPYGIQQLTKILNWSGNGFLDRWHQKQQRNQIEPI